MQWFSNRPRSLVRKDLNPQVQRRTGVNGKERAYNYANKGGTAESFGPLRDEGLFLLHKIISIDVWRIIKFEINQRRENYGRRKEIG